MNQKRYLLGGIVLGSLSLIINLIFTLYYNFVIMSNCVEASCADAGFGYGILFAYINLPGLFVVNWLSYILYENGSIMFISQSQSESLTSSAMLEIVISALVYFLIGYILTWLYGKIKNRN